MHKILRVQKIQDVILWYLCLGDACVQKPAGLKVQEFEIDARKIHILCLWNVSINLPSEIKEYRKISCFFKQEICYTTRNLKICNYCIHNTRFLDSSPSGRDNLFQNRAYSLCRIEELIPNHLPFSSFPEFAESKSKASFTTCSFVNILVILLVTLRIICW